MTTTSTTADFLVELGTEELPPKALLSLAKSFHDNLVKHIQDAELEFSDCEWFATPRRLAVKILGLSSQQADKQMERLGPAVAAAFNADGSAKPAAIGFAKSCNTDLDSLQRIETPKGERLAFNAVVKGKKTEELLPDFVTQALNKLPIPKAMRWGDSQAEFIRPPHWLLMLLGDQIVDAEILELKSGRVSYGHRFHAPQAITIQSPTDYESQLADAKVSVCFEARKAEIRNQVIAIADNHRATAVIDEELLDEVTALVEWPVALTGKFDESFLEVPAEALIATMASDQKYFHLLDENNKLLPRFITVSNIESSHPQSVISGNERVIRPRLADAKFFYDADKKYALSSYIDKLKTVVFQRKLGSIYDKTQRVAEVAAWVAEQTGAPVAEAKRAAELSKSDLMTSMVYEFPELQGIMGRYYATNDGETKQVAAAMDEVYQPRFAGDELPVTPVGVALAIADRVDTLVGIFGIGQAPTGAKDPFALRRSTLGLLRLLVEKQLDIDLGKLIDISIAQFKSVSLIDDVKQQILAFFAARSSAWYQDKGYSAQVFQSVTALNLSQPLDIDHRIKAIKTFNQLEASSALAAANKRVSNILAKANLDSYPTINAELLIDDQEKQLYQSMQDIERDVTDKVSNKQYSEALTQLASLRDVVDAFFDKVMVNVDDESTKLNRLSLLANLRGLFIAIADIALLQK